MEDLGFKQHEQTVLWEDNLNMACIYMSQTSVMCHKARHIRVNTCVYHLRELCKDAVLILEKVSSAEQVVDSLTKSTPKPAFEKHLEAMLGTSISTIPDKVPDDDVDNNDVDEMEGIELEAEGIEDGTESGLAAFYLGSECGDGDDPDSVIEHTWNAVWMPRLIILCIFITWYTVYFDAGTEVIDPHLVRHYAQLMIWLCNASLFDFHVFPPWERDMDQI
eukprot:2397244-Rhodomonas_salina.1